MPKEITAWEAEDGSVHATERLAAKHDAARHLTKLEIFNGATVNMMLERAEEIFNILKPIVYSAAPAYPESLEPAAPPYNPPIQTPRLSSDEVPY